MSAAESKKTLGIGSSIGIAVALLCIVGIEVFLTYQHWSTRMLLPVLLTMAFVEAGIAVMYLMHLKYERPNLFWSLIPMLLFVLFMMDHIWPDALRLEHFRVIHW